MRGRLTVSRVGAWTGFLIGLVSATSVSGVDPNPEARDLFHDDDGIVHEADIDQLALLGVARGCNPPDNDMFCPDREVTRGQMAAFLSRALESEAGSGDTFTDDGHTVYEGNIEALAEMGITRGCNPPANNRFCPDQAVTRGQMAAFLVRAFDLEDAAPDAFGDDDGSLFETDIDRLAAAGVTLGCNPPSNDRYCPDQVVRRGQMASLLVRALDHHPSEEPFSFTFGGDIGADENTDATMEAMAAREADFFLALGDLSYGDVEPESAWCNYVKGYLGADHPVQVVVGNHEDDDRDDGFIRNFAACLPDRMDSVGDYGVEYYFDVGDLARVIMLGARENVDGVDYDYYEGTERMAWLDSALEGAADKEWVIVGMHRVCLSVGRKTCEVGPDLMHRLLEAEVDLVVQAHDHNYQRSKQLTCAEVDVYRPGCVSDHGDDGMYSAGEGTVFVVSGVMGGGVIYEALDDDPEAPYFAAYLGADHPQEGYGYAWAEVSEDEIRVEFVGTTTGYTDGFAIR